MRFKIVFNSWSEPRIYDDASDAATDISQSEEYQNELNVDIDELLDEEGPVMIGGVEYYPSYILKIVDEYRYNEIECEQRETLAAENINEIRNELENMETGEETSFGSVEVECLEGFDFEDNEGEIEINDDLMEILS